MGTTLEVLGMMALVVLPVCFAVRWFIHAKTRWQGFIRGTITGGALGIAFAALVGMFFMLSRPNDPSAGSEAIIGMGTFPIGLAVGAVAGLLRPTRQEPTSTMPET